METRSSVAPPAAPRRSPPIYIAMLLLVALAAFFAVGYAADPATSTGAWWLTFAAGDMRQRETYSPDSVRRVALDMAAVRREIGRGSVGLLKIGKAYTPQDGAEDATERATRPDPAALAADTRLVVESRAPLFNPASILLYTAPSVGSPLLPVAFYVAFHALLAGWLALYLFYNTAKRSRRNTSPTRLGLPIAALAALAVIALPPDVAGLLPYTLALCLVAAKAFGKQPATHPEQERKVGGHWLLLTAPSVALLFLSTPPPLTLVGLIVAAILVAVLCGRGSYWLGWLGLVGIGTMIGSLAFAPRLAGWLAPGNYSDALFQRSVATTLRLGAYGLFIGGLCVALGYVVLLWQRIFVEGDDADAANFARRIFKNSLAPLLAQLLVKLVDLSFAFIVVRFIGVAGNGNYALAVVTFVFAATIADFGLETLITRDVARDRSPATANRYLMTAGGVRLALSALAVPASLPVIWLLSSVGNLAPESGWAIIILMVGLIPSTLSGSLAAVLRAYEKMEFPAVISIIAALLKISIGIGLLVFGTGVIGLALTSIIVNVVVLIIHYRLFTRVLFQPYPVWDGRAARAMLMTAYPLMLNGLLVNLFFKVDVFLLYPMAGDTVVGYYNGAYKFIDGLLILPSVLTFALFPAFSQYADGARDKLATAYAGALRILSLLSLPICVGTFFVAHDIIGVLLGQNFLPHSAIALQILIWFLPFSYINGVTQYVLIALNKQRIITLAFVGAFATNIIFNLIFIPFYGYKAAAVVTILSEIALLIPFGIIMRRAGVPTPLVATLAKPAIAAGVMGAVLWLLATAGAGFFVLVPAAIVVYAAMMVAIGGLTRADLALVRRVVRR